MPVNGIEIKEGQVWLDAAGVKRVIENNPSSKEFPWKDVRENGEWNTYTTLGTLYSKRFDGYHYGSLVQLLSEAKESNVKFNPKPGDKIICNNGKEATCCTLEFLHQAVSPWARSDKPILGYFKYEEEWQDWDEDGRCSSVSNGLDPLDIREVIPLTVEEELAVYSVRQVAEAIHEVTGVPKLPDFEDRVAEINKHLAKVNDPEWKEYQRLKEKFNNA